MLKLKYELKRLPDVEGRLNWMLSQVPKNGPYIHISWDRAYIEKEAAQLKVGETKIIETGN
jgi:hypothetical protein